MKADLLAIIPTYNEASNIRALTQAVLLYNPDIDLLIVDDNSPDGTGKIAAELAASDERIHLLNRAKKEGLGRAYIAGFTWALEKDYTYIMEMDCDFSHDPKAIAEFRKEMDAGYDLVLGSRYIDGVRDELAAFSAPTQSRCGSVRPTDDRHATHRSHGGI